MQWADLLEQWERKAQELDALGQEGLKPYQSQLRTCAVALRLARSDGGREVAAELARGWEQRALSLLRTAQTREDVSAAHGLEFCAKQLQEALGASLH